MAGLRIKNGPSQGQTFTIKEEPLAIGRDASCAISLQDKGASRRHAEVFSIGAMCFIRDLDSRNGSFVNDARIAEEMLRDGDRIQIGGTIMTFEAQGGIAADDDLEFSEEELQGFYELRLEDLTAMNVGEGDVSSEKHLRALYRLCRLVASEKTGEDLVKKVLAFVCESFQADGAYLFGRDPEKGNIVTLGSHTPKGRSGQLSRNIIRKALQDRLALLVTDAMRDDRFSSHESVMRHKIHTVLCAPLAPTGDIQGVLYIAGDDPGISFNEQELELAAVMADQIGLALAHIAAQTRRRDLALASIRMLLKAADVNHPGLAARNERVAACMITLGKALKISAPELDNLQLAGLVHNYALMATPPGTLDREAIPERSAELLADQAFFPDVADVVRLQLERYDGNGPRRMRGGDIPLSVRIFQAANDVANLDAADADSLKAAVSDMLIRKAYDPAVAAALSQVNKAGLLATSLDEHWRAEHAGNVATLLSDE